LIGIILIDCSVELGKRREDGMAARSLTATPDGIDDINRALTEKKWSREDLAKACDCSRQPAVKFCSGKAVSKKLFVSFCEALVLDWEEIAGLKTAAPTSNSAEPQADIDALVQTIRQQVQADIHHRCGTMRVLDMEQPIGIGDIYTNVNILEKLSGRRRLGLNELLQDCDLENFDRFLLGQIRHERVPGLEAVERHSQLMVLGKPGAGKTTFMKRLATLCNQGEFQAGRVPVFVTLKEFAEAKGQPDLQTYIGQQWAACGIEDTERWRRFWGRDRALILLDGLDEVQETDHDRILQEIKDFTGQYRHCQFVMTCRIAAREYKFQHFTEVELRTLMKSRSLNLPRNGSPQSKTRKGQDLYSTAERQRADSRTGNESAAVDAAVLGVWRSGRLSGQSLRTVQRRAGCAAEKVGRQAQH
jgi:predicted NACHT family NTPase